MLAKWWLTKQGLVSGHRCSAVGWLEFGRIGWQKQQAPVVGHPQMNTGMPASAVEHQDDLLGRTSAHGTRKRCQLPLEERYGDARG
jgi:hypothetical protein